MSSPHPMTIVGGGLAGLTLGIGLRQRGIPVTVWEAGCYPRHRVCGEFISGRGQDVLLSLGLRDLFERAGAIYSRTAQFFLGTGASGIRPITPPALCLSRFKMDQMLAERFRELGGVLRENSRWNRQDFPPGVIYANGRRMQAVEGGWRWFGLKIHARNIELDSDLEMHGTAGGYVGLCRLPDGETNVCGLFRSRPGHSPSAAMSLLCGQPGTVLQQRLAKAVLQEDSFCSVGGLSLRPRRASNRPDCVVGDALTMTPPVTGNGMSMAFEASAIALEPMTAYARGEISWPEARRITGRRCDAAFGQRLWWAAWLQGLMFSPLLQSQLGRLVVRSDIVWKLLFAHTRA